jgi:chorismate-pyruvate lyase
VCLSHAKAVEAGPWRLKLSPLKNTALDPFLRKLLQDDCLTTRALRDFTSAEIKVSVEEQVEENVSDSYASLLEIQDGSRVVRRRVVISVDGSAEPALFAESFVFPERLPTSFLASLATSTEGIGVTLQDLQVPARREMLALGLADGVQWRPHCEVGPVVVRQYRIVAGCLPAILINEAFPIETAPGQLHLANVTAG